MFHPHYRRYPDPDNPKRALDHDFAHVLVRECEYDHDRDDHDRDLSHHPDHACQGDHHTAIPISGLIGAFLDEVTNLNTLV
jgi:hypothetical protein